MRYSAAIPLVAFMLLAQQAWGLSLMEFDMNPMCYNDGHMEFTFGTRNRQALDPRFINVTARQEGSDAWAEVPGDFYEHYYHMGLDTYVWDVVETGWPHPLSYVNDKESMFSSKGGVFNTAGHYYVNITYPDTLRYRDGFFDCPGLIFSCALVNVSADRCFSRGGTFYAYFTGNGLNGQSDHPNARKINMTNEVVYRLTGPGYSFHGNSPNMTLAQSGEGGYVLSYNTSMNITYFEIEISPCYPGSFIARSRLDCVEPPECMSDAECDDNDSCTSDSCLSEVCSHEDACREAAAEPAVRDISEVAGSIEEPKAAEAPEAQENAPENSSGTVSNQAPGGVAGWLNSILKQIFYLFGIR